MYILHGSAKDLISVEVVNPWIAVRALLLARGELPLVSAMLQLALALLSATTTGPVGVVAVENAGGVNLRKRFREPCPSDDLL